MVHKRKSKKYYNELKAEVENKSINESNVIAPCFDYMQNLSLPKIHVQEMFYWRQLTVSVFCIHSNSTYSTHSFRVTEILY